jgi:Holliday junction resolvase RusA-like endonuclease
VNQSPIALHPTHPTPTVMFTVHGTPMPAGSKRAFFRGGRAVVVDANKKSRPWKDQVAQVAGDVMAGHELLRGPLELRLTFFVRRPKAHFGKNGVRAAAPEYPIGRPDVLKLARGVEDALSGVLYADDAQVVEEILAKRYGTERVEIEVREL